MVRLTVIENTPRNGSRSVAVTVLIIEALRRIQNIACTIHEIEA